MAMLPILSWLFVLVVGFPPGGSASLREDFIPSVQCLWEEPILSDIRKLFSNCLIWRVYTLIINTFNTLAMYPIYDVLSRLHSAPPKPDAGHLKGNARIWPFQGQLCQWHWRPGIHVCVILVRQESIFFSIFLYYLGLARSLTTSV